MIESNRYINKLKLNNNHCTCRFTVDGNINQYIILDDKDTTIIPKENDNFETIEQYLIDNNLEAHYELEWVQEVKDYNGNLLHYNTNLGKFIDSVENKISQEIKNRIQNKDIEIKEMRQEAQIESIEINVFLPRSFTLNGKGYPNHISNYTFRKDYLDIPFPVNVEILQTIEKDFFKEEHKLFTEHILRSINGNILRYTINQKDIKKVKITCCIKESLKMDLEHNGILIG